MQKKLFALLLLSILIQGCGIEQPASSSDENSHVLVWIDRQGQVDTLDIPPRNYIYAQLSPDEAQIALNIREHSSDIWLYDFQQQQLSPFTQENSANIGPLWAPDGRLAFTQIVNEIQEVAIQDTDTSMPAEQLSILSELAKYPGSFSADGMTLIYHTSTDGYDMWTLTIDGETRVARPLLTGSHRETNGVLSPDGNWLAYESDESGQLEIYISPFPDVNNKRVNVSTTGGSRAHWAPNGTEIFYIKQNEDSMNGALMSANISLNDGSVTGAPELLFKNIFIAPNAGHQVYDVSADGQRFLMIQSAEQATQSN